VILTREKHRLLVAKELQLTRSSRQQSLYFHGESMRPFLVEGDEVVVEPVDWDAIRIGDVITYRHLDRFPTRRVMRKMKTELLLWCDNWPERQFRATRDEVLGRAVARRRGAVWLSAHQLPWSLARFKARLRFEGRRLRRDVLPETWDRWTRRAPAKLLRLLKPR